MINALFRADDIGISTTTVSGARLAVEQGICRNVSVQAVGPHLDLVRELLVPFQRSGLIRIGVHVTVCCEWDTPRFGPLGAQPHPGLCDPDGAFVAHAGVLNERGIPPEAVVAEAGAQLAHLRAHGIAPDYLDEHMCFGWVPGVAAALGDLCRREGLIDADRLPFARATDRVRQPVPVDDVLAQLAAPAPGVQRFVGHPLMPTGDDVAYRLRGRDEDIVAARDAQRRIFTDPRIVGQVRDGRVASLRYDEVAAL